MLKIQSDRVIIDGHEQTKEQCETMTLLANALAESKNFKTVEYRDGYAEFEKAGKVDELKFWNTDLIDGTLNGETFNISAVSTSTSGSVHISASISTTGLQVTFSGTVGGRVSIIGNNAENYFAPWDNTIEYSAGDTANFEFKSGVQLLSTPGALASGFAITLSAPSKVRVDLTTLPGWESLSTGSHNITIVAKADGYRDSEPSAAVSVEKAAQAQIWGVSGLGNSDPTLTRTYDNVGKTYTINSAAGTITTDFDTEFNFETVVQDGNTMIKIPTFYKRFDTISNNQITAFSISKTKVNDDFVPYPCFVKQDGSGAVMDYILISKGKATGTSSKATCVSGSSPLVHVTRAQMRTAARANGTGWQQLDWMVLQLLRDLFCVVFATTNSQLIFLGRTKDFSNAATVGGTWNISTPCGWNTTTMQNRFFGIEDVFGNVYDWCDGVTFSDATVYSTVNYNHFTDGTSNMVNSGSRATSNGYIFALTYNTAQPFLNYPSAASGGETQYYCDYEWYSSSGVVLYVGGRWGSGARAGLWCSYGSSAASDSYPDVGGRLVYRHV